jgi:putative CocE/NonD family hydrolase
VGSRTSAAPRALRPLAIILLLIAIAGGPSLAAAQDFGFDAPTDPTDPALPEALRDLAERIVPVYKEEDADRYLANLAALQMVAGDPPAARETRLTLQERLRTEQGAPPGGRAVVYDIYTHARAIEAMENIPFPSAYEKAFHATWDGLDDLYAYELESSFMTPLEPLREAVQQSLEQHRDKSSISLESALELVRAWFAFEAYRSFGDVARLALAEDKEKRYAVEEIAIPVTRDAAVAATLVRPRSAAAHGTLPTLLEFTLDRSTRDARESSAHGYVSVLALSRIAGEPQSRPRAPFESDGDDARAVIDWIAHQPWSDGRVGMQGVGYGGFVAWSAAKRLPPALKAIATSDPMAPGIDVPMSNRIVASSAYRWVYRLLAPRGDELANDAARWREIDEEWYRSGRSYRDYPTLPGRATAVFRSWLNHPSYDRFWQKWLPVGDEFAAIDIPVLTVTGYYSAGETAALYYYTEHHAHASQADHRLLIGPFDERGVEHGASNSVRELALDPVARINPNDARYEWFDHALRRAERPARAEPASTTDAVDNEPEAQRTDRAGADERPAPLERPTLLSSSVNYQLAGADEWRQAPSLAALEQRPLRFYFAASPNAATHALLDDRPAEPTALMQTVDFRDRSDAEWRPSRELVLRQLQPREGTLFVTEPFADVVDIAGRLRGVLDFTINKYDVDLAMTLYELRADGEYVKLFDPAYAFRASYARDRVERRLLMAGVRQQLPFQSERMVGRRLGAGSRLVLAVAINKRADQQINYGTAGDVSEQSIADAGSPIRIRWHEGSFIEIALP